MRKQPKLKLKNHKEKTKIYEKYNKTKWQNKTKYVCVYIYICCGVTIWATLGGF